MPSALKLDRLRGQLRGIALTLAAVAITTVAVDLLIYEIGYTRGTVLFLIPVLLAATRWGLVSALVAAFAGMMASAFLFFPPFYDLRIRDPQEVINLLLYVFVAVVVSQLASRLSRQLALARRREVDTRNLYDFMRRLAGAFAVSDIHAAIEDHLATVTQHKVVLFANARDAIDAANGKTSKVTVPKPVLAKVIEVASARDASPGDDTVTADDGDTWMVRAVSPKTAEFGVIAINLDRDSARGERGGELRSRVDAVLADATATLERLDIARAIGEARMRSQTDQLREALIESVSHELRTPLASILGAATVLSAAPALARRGQAQGAGAGRAQRGGAAQQRHPEPARRQPHRQQRSQAPCRMGGTVRHHQFGDRPLPPPARRSRRPQQPVRRSAAGPRRSGARAAGSDPDLRQCGEIFVAGLHHHGVGACPRRRASPSASAIKDAG